MARVEVYVSRHDRAALAAAERLQRELPGIVTIHVLGCKNEDFPYHLQAALEAAPSLAAHYLSCGITALPAVVVEGKAVAKGSIPTPEEVKLALMEHVGWLEVEWLPGSDRPRVTAFPHPTAARTRPPQSPPPPPSLPPPSPPQQPPAAPQASSRKKTERKRGRSGARRARAAEEGAEAGNPEAAQPPSGAAEDRLSQAGVVVVEDAVKTM